MRVLVACEFSGTVRSAFAARGHDAWSCDLLPSEDGSNRHITGDARDLLGDGWDLLMVAHPPCTRLCNSGVRWLTAPPRDKTLEQMWDELERGAALFSTFWNAPIERIAIENPIMHRHARERIVGYERPAQIVQPWWFGEPQFKGIGLYLRGLLPLTATKRLSPPSPGTIEHKQWSRTHRFSGWGRQGQIRAHERSRFFPCVAEAMADQWSPEADLVIRMAA